jgi:hypothetical protein
VAIPLGVTPAHAAFGESKVYQWQVKRLFEPTPQQLADERRGKVFIYEGLKDKDVNRAMKEQFDRVHAMMFTGVVVTDTGGEPVRDNTGEVVVEQDGCP